MRSLSVAYLRIQVLCLPDDPFTQMRFMPCTLLVANGKCVLHTFTLDTQQIFAIPPKFRTLLKIQVRDGQVGRKGASVISQTASCYPRL